jgi:branched-chain amino acid transport system substrate-binding protein
MLSTVRSGAGRTAAIALVGVLLAAGCGSPQSTNESPSGEAADAEPVQVGLVYSQSGPLQAYGEQYIAGFEAGLDFATDGTGEVDGRPIEVTERDDTGDPAKAVSEATDLIGQGYQILAGSTSSGVALQVAPLAEQNEVLFISGPAATDGITGINDYTFRSGRQTYQDVLTSASFIGDPAGQTVLVFAQDNAFGQANVAAVTAVLGGAGATVEPLLVPETATDITTFAAQAASRTADLVFVAWAGTTAGVMWQSLDQQGVFDASTVVTGLDIEASYPIFGTTAPKISFLSHYFGGATDNETATAMKELLEGTDQSAGLFVNDGFVAAQMVVRAIAEGGDDVDAMVAATEGWQFEGPKGDMEIRAEDHAMLQPMFQVTLEVDGDTFTPSLVETLAPEDVAPPVATG